MATIIYPQGLAEFTVPDTQKVSVYSLDVCDVFTLVGYPNYPSVWKLLASTTAGTQYVSAAVSGDTRVRVAARAAQAVYVVGASPSATDPTADINAADATFDIAGLGAAQGGYVKMTGGTSTTAGNAGGAATIQGGTPGVTGVGGAAAVTGAVGGATSGAGGAATVTGGAGTNGNAVGGAANVTGGAGQGSAAGGAMAGTGGAGGATGAGGSASVVGGIGGATSGNGGQALVTGGAATNGNGNGGSVILAGGAKNGSGVNGMIIDRSVKLVNQGAPTAKTVSATLTAAEVLAGIITVNQGGGAASAQQLPTASAMDTAIPDSAGGDAFDFTVINISTVDAEDASVTTNAGWTLVGAMEVPAYNTATNASLNSSARFRARKTGGGAWVLYRLS